MTTTAAKDGALNVPRYTEVDEKVLGRGNAVMGIPAAHIAKQIVADNHSCLDRIAELEGALKKIEQLDHEEPNVGFAAPHEYFDGIRTGRSSAAEIARAALTPKGTT